MKYSLKFKLECVDKYKNYGRAPTPEMTKSQHDNLLKHVRVWAKAYEDLGIDGLRHRPHNKGWTLEERFDLVASGLPVRVVARWVGDTERMVQNTYSHLLRSEKDIIKDFFDAEGVKKDDSED
ncbi:MAG: hypothetical protein II721_07290 [Bacilli bacterium]|nr:hypothetical protein [Bacilli bacterium]